MSIVSNKLRFKKQSKLEFELHPNCLLTRWPLLFITGPRSFFYFETYWNGYTSFLAEHGYEVFILNLPWNKKASRQERFQEFIKQQESLGNKFHIFMDLPTYREMQNFILNQKSICIKSISLITEDSDTPNLNQNDLDCLYSLNSIVFNKANPEVNLNQICFNLHKLFLKQYQKLPNLNTLGACKKTVLKNGQLLLGRAQFLAEEDHCL